MAQRELECDGSTPLPIADGANADAALTTRVRVIFENTDPKDEIIDAIQRAKEAITEILADL